MNKVLYFSKVLRIKSNSFTSYSEFNSTTSTCFLKVKSYRFLLIHKQSAHFLRFLFKKTSERGEKYIYILFFALKG